MKNSATRSIIALCLALQGCSSSPTQMTSRRTPTSLTGIDIKVLGGDEHVSIPPGIPLSDPRAYDVIIIGAGLAGLSSAVYLTDAGQKILLLEKENHLGGLAAWTDTGSHVIFDRGAAYWTDTYEEEQAILNHIGLSKFREHNEIPEPIDSYLVRGKLYPGIWNDDTLKELPASFELFRFELHRANAKGQIPNQPFEEFPKYGGKMDLDALSAKRWIEDMPAQLKASLPALAMSAKNAQPSPQENVETNAQFAFSEAQRILERYDQELATGRLQGRTGMGDVTELMDLYCRSALGSTSEQVSAMAFANFYISEITPRFTSPKGTGIAADKMYNMLIKRPKLATMKANAPVWKIVSKDNHVEVSYASSGKNHTASSRYVVFAAQLTLAPKLIQDFAQEAPQQTKMIQDLNYAHYSVHNVYLEGHPYRTSYDTWMHATNYTDDDPTDVILGRWMDPQMLGYQGYREFKKNPPDAQGLFTIYQGLPPRWLATDAYSVENAKNLALTATERVEELLSALPPSVYQGPLKVEKIETSRWPLSVHIATPGHYTEKARVLRRPFKRVFFANNNLGTPAFEEALFRGHCAADNILLKIRPGFKVEKWTRCPID